jgi:pimeloyl-ACP methyl ester carboxylesterase
VRTVDLPGGRRASYEVVGVGAPTLMLPGGPGFSSAYMRGTADLFADVLECHLIDPHGSGGSTPPADPGDYGPEGHAGFYEDVRQALGLGPITVFGHSFGAITALAYSALYPDAVERCIALAAAAIGPDPDEAGGGEAAAQTEAIVERHKGAPWYAEAKLVWDSWTERVLAARDSAEVDRMITTVLPLYTAHPGRPEVAAALKRFGDDMKMDLAAAKAWESGMFQGLDVRPLLSRIEAPTLLVAGELDLICGPVQANPLARAIQNAELVIIPDCGHLQMVEAPHQLRQQVLAWLGR